MKKDISRLKGFTIAEMLVSAVLIVIVLTISYNIYLLAKEVWLYVYVEGNMLRTGTEAVEKMIHGVEVDKKGIQEAQDIITPASGTTNTRIEFVDQDNPALSRAFYKSGSTIRYEDEDNAVSDLVEEDVSQLSFTRPAARDNTIEITLVLQRTVLEKNVSVSFNTTVEVRNM